MRKLKLPNSECAKLKKKTSTDEKKALKIR